MPSLFATNFCLLHSTIISPFLDFLNFPIGKSRTSQDENKVSFSLPTTCALNNSVYNETVRTCRTEVDNNFLRQELKAKYVLELYLLKQKNL